MCLFYVSRKLQRTTCLEKKREVNILAFWQIDDLVFGSLHTLTMDYQGGGGDTGTFYPLHFGAGAPQ